MFAPAGTAVVAAFGAAVRSRLRRVRAPKRSHRREHLETKR
jgi:hypothetical protein